MKTAIHKSSIPLSQIFVIKELKGTHFDPVWHAHPEYQLFVVLEGIGTRFIGDSIKRFEPGELVLTGPHLPHLWRSDEGYFERRAKLRSRGIVIYLNESFLGDHFLEKDELVLLKRLFQRSMQGIEFFGRKKSRVITMMKELVKMRGIDSLIQLLQILNLLVGCNEYEFLSDTAYENPHKESEADRMNKVYDFVLKNFRKKISLEEVATLTHMTPTSFSRYFTMKNNKTFSRFLTELRIKHACKLLQESDVSITDVCYDSGFNTLSNFNRQFKEVTSRRPLEYKRQFLNM